MSLTVAVRWPSSSVGTAMGMRWLSIGVRDLLSGLSDALDGPQRCPKQEYCRRLMQKSA